MVTEPQRRIAIVPRAPELRASLERLEFLARSRGAAEIAALARMALTSIHRRLLARAEADGEHVPGPPGQRN
jgi:hypothetical protein